MNEVIAPSRDEPINDMVRRADHAHPSAAAFMLMSSWHWTEAQTTNDAKATNDGCTQKHDHVTEKGQVHNQMDIVNQTETSMLVFSMQKYPLGSPPDSKKIKSIISTGKVVAMSNDEIKDVANSKYRSVLLSPKKYGTMHHFKGRCEDQFDFILCDKMLQSMTVDSCVTRLFKNVCNNSGVVSNHLQLI